MLNQALEYAKQNQERFLTELNEVLTIPSISTDPDHKADMQYAAEWMSAQLKSIGMSNVQIMPTGGHPVVYGEWLGAGKDFADRYDLWPLRCPACRPA